ncbi:unnamed protein product [Trichobilharzia szidati]|nr:unnamed protein product [Trichobilharzia szidati]
MNALAPGYNGNQPAVPISVDIKKLFDGIMLSHRYTSWVQVQDALSQLESVIYVYMYDRVFLGNSYTLSNQKYNLRKDVRPGN